MSHRKLSDTLEVRQSLDGHVWIIGHRSNSAIIETFKTEEEARKRLAVLDAAPELLEALQAAKTYFTLALDRADPYPAIHDGLSIAEQAIKKATE